MPRHCALIWALLIPIVVSHVVASRAASNQASPDASAFYISPTFGYIIPNIASPWQAVKESSENRIDRLELTDGTSTIKFDAFRGFDGDPEGCLADATDKISAYDRIEAMAPAEYETGDLVEAHDERSASRAYMTVDRAVQTSSGFTVWEITCLTLVDGQAVLRVTHTLPAEQYFGFTPLLFSVQLPRAAFGPTLPARPAGPNCGRIGLPPHLLLDESGNEVGAVAPLASGFSPDPDKFAFDFSFENTGAEVLLIDLSAVFVEDLTSGEPFFPASVNWIAGAESGSLSASELAPGEIAVGRIVFSPRPPVGLYDVYYAASADSLTVIESIRGGCAGARPRIRVGM